MDALVADRPASAVRAPEHFDVLIVGAGLSGIGAGYHLQKECPGKTYAILEARDAIGGTWDLFRYPGIRSDSDMYTLGYNFKPWTEAKAIADGPAILKYVRETAADHGIDRHIRFNRSVTGASWSSADSRWTVDVAGPDGATERYTCGFLFMCSGYYRYDAGYTPEFPGRERFRGRIVHPQHWPEDLDYAGKKVVVIGSGATAVTLVPEMAKTAGHVTMLQRSPTYVVSRPAEDAVANTLRKMLPQKLAYSLVRWKNVLFGMYFFRVCKTAPQKAKDFILGKLREELPADMIEKHFTPRYNVWDQRLCLVPDSDMFVALKNGTASVVTDTVEAFDETGIRLGGGGHLDADIIVTATGLELQVLGGMSVTVDGCPVDMAQTVNYKGMMFSGVPNLASSFGYTNASWTLKCDLTCAYVCRLLKHMDAQGFTQCTPKPADPDMPREPWVDFSSGYFQRALARFPKQGARVPWRLHQNYARDLVELRYGSVEDEMAFSGPTAPAHTPAATAVVAG
jgi:cation diffusion facilitator CzcD-associated flavoprotein CzcO